MLNDWSARDLQRDETPVRLGPAKGKDFALSIGPWLVTPDELADRREPAARRRTSRSAPRVRGGRHGDRDDARLARHDPLPAGGAVARASADVHLRPGELLGTGTVGGGCLLEIGEERLGRWLEPGDEVTLEVERLGGLVTPIVTRPGA